MSTSTDSVFPAALGCLDSIPRKRLFSGQMPVESMPILTEHCDGARLFVKRDDCTGLAFGGNKARQLEFYLGEANARDADTVLITGAVQSNFARMAAAGARKLGMECHIQQEERVTTESPYYRDSGNVFIEKLLGATLHTYPEGEDESGADRQLASIAAELQASGRKTYIIPLAPGHPPLGALGYVVAAHELLGQFDDLRLKVDEIIVGSGSGATHAGLLFGLRALGSAISVVGVCVRRNAELQGTRISETCDRIATLLEIRSSVSKNDIILIDDYLAPGYGIPNPATMNAIVLGARKEALMLDPVYTGKVFAAVIDRAKSATRDSVMVFIHTGGTPAIFAYQDVLGQGLHGANVC